MTMRLFLAISIEGAMQDSLLKLQHHWRYIGVRGHFVPAENMHLTLAFIGEYGNPDVVMDAISSVSFTPFTIKYVMESSGFCVLPEGSFRYEK
jgi:RNA 2',3'-cyclic 3'-phosphodiesterase